MKEEIVRLKQNMADAKTRQAEASKDAKRIEKDMSEFSNNKDSKLAELQKSLDALKKSYAQNTAANKTLQKELQNGRVESEQAASDLSASEEQLAEADETLKAQKQELESLLKEQKDVKVGRICKYRHNDDTKLL